MCNKNKIVRYETMIKFMVTMAIAAFVAISSDDSSTSIVMLGDSITYEGYWKNLLNRDDLINMGKSGDRTDGIFARSDEAVEHHPKIVFLMAGINDFASGISAEEAFKNLKNTADYLIGENIDVVITSTLRVGDKARSPMAWNRKVRELNIKLREYCKAADLTFIDLNRELAPHGKLEDRFTFDGVHIDLSAYRIWGTRIREVLREKQI